MSFSLDLDTNRRTAYFTGQGSCDYVDFCVALNGLLNHPLYKPGMSTIWDWQRCEILLANTQICSIIETMTRFAGPMQTQRIGIITHEKNHDAAATFQKYTETMTPNWRVLLFSSLEQVDAWVNGPSFDGTAGATKQENSLPPGTTAFFKPQAPRNGLWMTL